MIFRIVSVQLYGYRSTVWAFSPFCFWSFNSVQFSHSVVSLFATPWTAARQASLSITNSRSLPKLMCIESVMPSNHLILRCPLLPLPSIFPGIRVFSNESALHIRWPKYWSFSFNISPSNEHPGLVSLGWTSWYFTRLFFFFKKFLIFFRLNFMEYSWFTMLH